MMAVMAVLITLTAGLAPLASALGPRGPVPNTDSEPNNIRSDATDVNIAGKIPGTMLGSDHWDNYRFQLDLTGGNAKKVNIDVVFDKANPLVSVYLRDVNGFLLDFSRDLNSTTVTAVGSGPAAWYYLNITDDTLLGITYNVTYTFSSVTFAGDSNNNPSEANAVGAFPYSINTTADGDSEPMDRQDFYKVSLSRTVSKADLLVVQLTQDSAAQFWVEVFDAAFAPVSYEKQGLPAPGSTQVVSYGTKVAGIYYIRVWAAAGTGHYTLNMDRVEIDLNDNNDKAVNATAISLTGNHTAMVNGNVGEGLDLADYYSLTVVKGQVINATITSLNYNATTQLPKMHLAFLGSDGTTQWNTDPNMTDEQLDPTGYTNSTAIESGPVTNYIKVFVDNIASGGGAYDLNIFTDRPPVVNQSLIASILINESTVDSPTQDTSIKLRKLFSDPDGNDIVNYSYLLTSDQGMDDPANLTVSFAKDINMTVTLAPRPGGAGQSGYRGEGDLVLTAADNHGLNATAKFPIKVSGTNHAPYIKSPYNATNEFPEPLTLLYSTTGLVDIVLTKLFGDIDQNDKLTYDINGTSPALEFKTYGYTNTTIPPRKFLKSITINDTFVISFNLMPNQVDQTGVAAVRLNTDSPKVKKAIEDRTVLEDYIWFMVYDNGVPSKWADQGVKLLLRAVSPNGTPPKWVQSFTEITFKEDESVTMDLDTVTSDIDIDDATARTYSVQNQGLNITVSKIDRSKFKFTAKENWNNLVTGVVLNCTDTYGLYKTHIVDIRVVPVPDPAIITNVTPTPGTTISMNEGSSNTFGITITDVDSNIETDFEYNWSLDGIWMRTIVGNHFTYQPSFDEAGAHVLKVVVSEKANPQLNGTANWTVSVINVNRAPTGMKIVSPDNGGKYKEKTVIPLMAAAVTDPDKEDTPKYTWKVDGTTVATGQTYQLQSLKKGTHVVTLEVTDGKVTLTQTVNITVNAKTVTTDYNTIYLAVGLLSLMLVIIVAAFALRGKKVDPKEDKVDIYAADRAAQKKGLKGKKTVVERIEKDEEEDLPENDDGADEKDPKDEEDEDDI